jgi:glycosyltransferase involved in cell wall biosynthesis
MEGSSVELEVIGAGKLLSALVAKVEKRGLPVKFLGNVPNRDLPGHFNRASAFVLPSHIEHHPKALLEAMSCGLPVIGSDVPGIRELIAHRETGYLCEPSAEGIKSAVQNVLGDQKLRMRIGQNAREFITAHFALDKVVPLETSLLEELAQ